MVIKTARSCLEQTKARSISQTTADSIGLELQQASCQHPPEQWVLHTSHSLIKCTGLLHRDSMQLLPLLILSSRYLKPEMADIPGHRLIIPAGPSAIPFQLLLVHLT